MYQFTSYGYTCVHLDIRFFEGNTRGLYVTHDFKTGFGIIETLHEKHNY